MKKYFACLTLVTVALLALLPAACAENAETRAWRFVEDRMRDANGIVYYLASPGGNSRNAVVESMGQAMEYLALAGDAQGFTRYAEATDRAFKDADGYYYWQIDLTTGQGSEVTASLDDLRLFKAYRLANGKGMENYDATLKKLAEDIYRFDVNADGYLVSSYAAAGASKASRIDLFYIDAETMKEMASYDSRWQQTYEKGREILLQMPENAQGFYPRRFNVRNGQYDPIAQTNMVENLYTALFARDAGKDARAFAEFLKAQVAGGKIYNAYDANGNPLRGEGESVAVYALAARFLEGMGEREAAKWCRDRFLSSQVASGTFAGGFSMDADQSVYAFDQLEALLALRTLPSYADGSGAGGGGGGCNTGAPLALAILCLAQGAWQRLSQCRPKCDRNA